MHHVLTLGSGSNTFDLYSNLNAPICIVGLLLFVFVRPYGFYMNWSGVWSVHRQWQIIMLAPAQPHFYILEIQLIRLKHAFMVSR
jgi:hypothetical protein